MNIYFAIHTSNRWINLAIFSLLFLLDWWIKLKAAMIRNSSCKQETNFVEFWSSIFHVFSNFLIFLCEAAQQNEKKVKQLKKCSSSVDLGRKISCSKLSSVARLNFSIFCTFFCTFLLYSCWIWRLKNVTSALLTFFLLSVSLCHRFFCCLEVDKVELESS